MFPLQEFLVYLGVRDDLARVYAGVYLQILKKYDITTVNRLSALFANVLVETGYLKRVSENLNYSSEALARCWPSKFRGKDGKPNALALKIGHKPILVANYAYGDKMGNGHPSSGDGWKYRGRGCIQLTGKDNYQAFKDHTKVDVINKPDLLLEPSYGALASCYYWKINNINRFADKNDLDGCRDMVNKGRKTLTLEDDYSYRQAKELYEKGKRFFALNNIKDIQLP